MIALAMEAENEIDSRLSVGDGCFHKNKENQLGVIREIDHAKQLALVEFVLCRFDSVSRENIFVPTGNRELVLLRKLNYQPTPETIQDRKNEIRDEWSKLEEKHRRGTIYRPLEVEQDARFSSGQKRGKHIGQ